MKIPKYISNDFVKMDCYGNIQLMYNSTKVKILFNNLTKKYARIKS